MVSNLSHFQDVGTPISVDWYHEKDRVSDTLLMTVGDSWTWGDSLGNTSAGLGRDDRSYRLSKIYGNLVADDLVLDHINIGLPGLSNFDMLQRFRRVHAGLTRSYQKVYVVFTLTEIGRDYAGGLLAQKESWENIRGGDWPAWQDIIDQRATEYQLKFAQQELTKGDVDLRHHLALFLGTMPSKDIKSVMEFNEHYVTSLIMDTLESMGVEWAIGSAFTSWIDPTLVPKDRYLGQWTDIIAAQGNLVSYPSTHLLSQAGMIPLIDLCDRLQIPNRQHDWIDYFDRARDAIDWLSASPYNSQVATRHPLEQAHRWWADRIKEWIND